MKPRPSCSSAFGKRGAANRRSTGRRRRDQALCFGWIDGVRKSLGDEAYTIRFTPRRRGSIWSKVNVDRFNALKADGQMTPAGELAYEENKHKSGLYSYEKPLASLDAGEDEAVSQVQEGMGLLGKPAARLLQVGAQLDHDREKARNPSQAARDADRGLQRGPPNRWLRLAQKAMICVTAPLQFGPTARAAPTIFHCLRTCRSKSALTPS
jgi:hypothetical protein